MGVLLVIRREEDRTVPPVFHWPQHSFLLEHIRQKESCLDQEVQEHLQQLNILSEESHQWTDGKICLAAKRSVLWSRKKFYITFDIFLARDRPGLGMDENSQSASKKRKRKNRPRKKKKDVSIEESLKTLFSSVEDSDMSRTI